MPGNPPAVGRAAGGCATVSRATAALAAVVAVAACASSRAAATPAAAGAVRAAVTFKGAPARQARAAPQTEPAH
jgi:hypothetical protein